MIKWFISVSALLAVGAGSYLYFAKDPLQLELNRHWPPVSADQQRQSAIDSAATTLSMLGKPNVAGGADAASIQEIALKRLKSKGVTKLTVGADQQLIALSADFDVTLKSDLGLHLDSTAQSLVETLSPRIVGRIDVFFSVATAVSENPNRTLLINLLPAVHRVQVDKLVVNGSYDITSAGDVLATILNRYADNLSAILSESPLMGITLPATLSDVFDPSGPIAVHVNEAPDLKLSIAAHPLKSTFGLGAVALFIDDNKVMAIAQLPLLEELPPQPDPVKGTFDGVKAAFKKAMQDGLEIADPPGGVWVAVSKAFVAQGLDSAFSQAQLCLEASGITPVEAFSVKIPTPEGSDINCAPTRDCTPKRVCTPTRDCTPTENCDLQQDTRDCSRCFVSAFGRCRVRGNDPICEGAKAAQNVGYAAAKASCETRKTAAKADCERIKEENRLDCERLKAQEKGQCELEKTAQKKACEVEKGFIVALHRTGNIGNFDGSVSGNGALKMCFKDVHFSTQMDKGTLRIETSGSASLDTSFKFTPLDVAGHVLCPFEWTADKRIDVSIPSQSIGVSASANGSVDQGTLRYQVRVDEIPVHLHFEPSPLALVTRNVNFTLACPVAAGLINGMTLGLAPFIPELLKDYTYKLKPISFSTIPKLPSASILGQTLTPKLSETSAALVVSGKP